MNNCLAICLNGARCNNKSSNPRSDTCNILAHRLQSLQPDTLERAQGDERERIRHRDALPLPPPPPPNDPVIAGLLLELARSEERLAQRAAQAERIEAQHVARREAARRAELAAARVLQQLAYGPENQARGMMIMAVDPRGGGAHLADIALDSQNVHRSSIQENTYKSIQALLARPVDKSQNTKVEIMCALEHASHKVISEFLRDYELTAAFNTTYQTLATHVWSVIRSHKHRSELVRRLKEEIIDGTGKCSNGKMVRLVNVLAGYDDAILTDDDKATKLQEKMAAISRLPLTERKSAAMVVLEDVGVAEAERMPWLEALDVY